MDTSSSRYGRLTPDIEAWSSDVASSPTPVPTRSSKFAFDLNSIRFQTSQSLPIIHSAKCPRAPQCKHVCCVSANAHESSARRPLLSPAHGQRQLNGSGSYGSMDRTEPDHDIMQVNLSRQSSLVQDGYDLDTRPEVSIRCGCHVVVKDKTSRAAKIKLVIASIIALVFMVGEVLGGYFAGSLAIMTDAAHMLSDLAGFLISLFAIWVGSRPASKRMSFGWYRAEVIGAIISVLIVWVLTGVLFYEAIQRVINPDLINVKADIMLITACVGVFVNVFMCAVLGHGHGHSHGGGGHGHSHGGHSHSEEIQETEIGKRGHDTEQGEEDDSQLGLLKQRLRRKKKQENSENINVRAAFIHVIGDLIQSIGVVIAGYIIWFKPDWKLADPICTFLFCVLVLFSTINVLKDALRVLMEGTPKHVDYEDVKADLQEIPGVKHAHSLHIWSLTTTRTALAAHLAVEHGANIQEVLDKASKMLKDNHNIVHTTLQVEEYRNLMDDCGTCQERKRRSFCWPC